MAKPIRKPNRLPLFDYAQNGAYMITICTIERRRVLWKGEDRIRLQNGTFSEECRDGSRPRANMDFLSDVGRMAEKAILRIPIVYPSVCVDRYCIMPDHVHLLLRIQSSDADGRMRSAPTISTVVGQTKRIVSKWAGQTIWQKSFHDHVIRNEQDYIEAMRYIDNNLVRQTEHIPKGE